MADFKPSQYIVAPSVDEIPSLLDEHKGKARIIAGGTLIHELSFRGLLENISTLIDISKIGLNYVKWEKGTLRIGATTTFTELLDVLSAKAYPELALLEDALKSIRPIQVRNVATVGGSICSGLPFFDLPVALLALDATVRIVGLSKQRELKISDFSRDYFSTDLKNEEFVTEIQIPNLPIRTSGAFLKLETNSVDWALVNTATRVSKDGDKMRNVRITIGGNGVERKVIRALNVESALEEKVPSEEVIAKATEFVATDVNMASDFRASSEYRTEIARVFVRRCLRKTFSRIK